MKLNSSGVIALLFFSCLQISCGKKGCNDLTADNFNIEATKNDGSCIYSASSFYGNYHVEDIVIDTFFNDTIQLNYDINIFENFGNEVSVFNLTNSKDTMSAIIKNGSIIEISYHGLKQIYYEGSGTCTGDTIKWNYNINHGDRIVSGVCIRY